MTRRGVMTLALLVVCGCALAIPAAAPAGGRPLSVVLVLDAGTTPTEHDAVGQGYRGFLDAVKRYHVVGRVATVDPQQNPTGLLYSLARQRYDLIITGVVGPDFVDSAARRFPRSRFFMPDDAYGSLQHRSRNVQGTVFRSEQPAYLAGYLAALVARSKDKNTVSSIGGLEFDTTAPVLHGARNKLVAAPRGAKRALVRYALTAKDDVDGAVPVSCRPKSGSRFRIGRTRVSCSATDSSANTGTASFAVLVKPR